MLSCLKRVGGARTCCECLILWTKLKFHSAFCFGNIPLQLLSVVPSEPLKSHVHSSHRRVIVSICNNSEQTENCLHRLTMFVCVQQRADSSLLPPDCYYCVCVCVCVWVCVCVCVCQREEIMQQRRLKQSVCLCVITEWAHVSVLVCNQTECN